MLKMRFKFYLANKHIFPELHPTRSSLCTYIPPCLQWPDNSTVLVRIPVGYNRLKESNLSRRTRKPTIRICENKGAITAQLISAFVFATPLVQPFYFNRKPPASSHFLCLYSSVCVGPVRKPHSFLLTRLISFA